MKKTKLNPILSGVAGEYLVAGELSRRGYLASITLRNTKGADILVSNENSNKLIAIQVKTNQAHDKYWILHKKAEKIRNDNFFYIFVNLNNGKEARFFVVPSKIVANFTTKYHKDYIAVLKRNGKKRKDSTMRKFLNNNDEYLSRWNLLDL